MENTEIQTEQEEKTLDALARVLVLIAKESVWAEPNNNEIENPKIQCGER